MEAIASMELCTSLASGLTMATSVAMELAVGLTGYGLTTVNSVTAELAAHIGEEEPEFTFADRLAIWA